MRTNSKMAVLAASLAAVLTSMPLTAAEVPRADHPQPDLYRENWMTLNGEWQFEIDEAGDGESRGLTSGKDLNSRILVPFCPESNFPAWRWATPGN